ncbi:MAG: cyclic pyranopterin monophosphate synthase MoaC [Clostridiaceae bacterium]|nr:cyclic pyranopterin monophosphate synthase MoaC [Clostridiaceae bacterium]
MEKHDQRKPISDDRVNSDLTHLNSRGEAHMVDVGAKSISTRHARAQARVRMQPTTLARLMNGSLPKGDVLAVVRTAAIMAAKKTPDLIPLCHPLMLSRVTVDIEPTGEDTITIETEVACSGQTGVEMEALTAVSVAALTLYDMCKAIDRGMTIEKIRLIEKAGGKSGHWQREKTEE